MRENIGFELQILPRCTIAAGLCIRLREGAYIRRENVGPLCTNSERPLERGFANAPEWYSVEHSLLDHRPDTWLKPEYDAVQLVPHRY